jgi:DNA-binding NtrC family response regulator
VAATETLSRLRLLIVDDDPQLAEFLREALETRFSLIVVVAGLAQAKGLMDGPFVFHAVVCDYQLNDGTGTDFYRWLRRVRHDLMPFIMISGQVETISENDPAFGFLAKPFLPATLCDLLQELQAKIAAAAHSVR